MAQPCGRLMHWAARTGTVLQILRRRNVEGALVHVEFEPRATGCDLWLDLALVRPAAAAARAELARVQQDKEAARTRIEQGGVECEGEEVKRVTDAIQEYIGGSHPLGSKLRLVLSDPEPAECKVCATSRLVRCPPTRSRTVGCML